MVKKRKRHTPKQIVKKLRDGEAMLNTGQRGFSSKNSHGKASLECVIPIPFSIPNQNLILLVAPFPATLKIRHRVFCLAK